MERYTFTEIVKLLRGEGPVEDQAEVVKAVKELPQMDQVFLLFYAMGYDLDPKSFAFVLSQLARLLNERKEHE